MDGRDAREGGRPAKVAVGAGVLWAQAALTVLGGIILFAAAASGTVELRPAGTVAVVAAAFGAVASAVLAWCVWRAANWARLTVLVLSVAGLFVSLGKYGQTGDALFMAGALTSSVMVYLMASAEARDWCRGESPSPDVE
ncbi:hypothetical protein [Salininema proteolyticum]|uniref:Integral membrane protein n=1 Tax=Salininema proteolyticum TaxID=1607685 RepID=A0ABV8TZY1_9ACTN